MERLPDSVGYFDQTLAHGTPYIVVDILTQHPYSREHVTLNLQVKHPI